MALEKPRKLRDFVCQLLCGHRVLAHFSILLVTGGLLMTVRCLLFVR